jgi:CHAT domain-containing protein
MARGNNSTPITFVVPGQRRLARGAGAGTAAPGMLGLQGQVKDAVRVSARRSAGETVRLSATPGEDLVLLQLAGGPPLLLHPDNARDLLRGQGTQRRGSLGAGDDVEVPAQLRWQGLEQAAPTRSGGFLGDVLLQAFEVITGVAKDPAADFVASQVVQKVDGQVDAGVYALARESLAALKNSGRKLAQVPAPASPATQALLVLVHGTFVDTFSTFGKLWALHPQRVGELFDHYGGRVYALDHPTIGASPIANALTLVNALPAGARLHLVTHSRGGLVAEVLARVCGQKTLDARDLDFFKGPEYAQQRQDLQALHAAAQAKGLRVDRVVRVACPARGTLLASGRLDAYLSVLKWSIELAGVPLLPSLVDFLSEVARRRASPALLPGLAAMIPESPLVNWLNGAEDPIPGELRVVAGDLQGDSVGSWLKTLLADAYYWTDNDIVVQTRSMYGGTPREGGASFLLDQGGKVTHFNYFANERTVAAVVGGLTQAAPAGFRAIGPLSWAGQDSGGLRAARRSAEDGRPASEKPAVFMLPGILGSHLKAGDKRIWLSLRLVGGLGKLKYEAGVADDVLPDGPIGMVYDDLMEHLAASHEVIPFAFDWRRPIEEEARRLADAVELALDARNASGQPVRLLAHSMGGVLARTMQLERPQTWERLMKREGARLLMLGTPNGGSWAPMQVLSGDDSFGNTLAAFGSPLANRQARQLMAAMPGFIQLQAGLLDPTLGLDRADTWARLAAADLQQVREHSWWHQGAGESTATPEPAYEWGLPPQAVLDQARALRQRLDGQRDTTLPAFAAKLLLVVGHAKFTPDGFEQGNEGFVYLDTPDGGDGRVPLWSALLPGVRTWQLDCEHGSLPDESSAFEAFTELLSRGDTTRLQRLAAPAATRGAASPVHVRSRPSRARPRPVPADSERAVFTGPRDGGTDSPAGSSGSALRVTVLNGNLSFVGQPLMLGHTRALALTGTEGVVNALIGGGMKASLDAGLYPDAPGSHQIFVNSRTDPENPWRAPQPSSVVVVGLGQEGKLTEQQLTHTVRQGTLAWAQRRAEDPAGAPATIALAATLMGSGGVSMNASNAARAIAQGVREANERLAGRGWPLVAELTLVELYLERASDAWHGLQVLAAAAPGRFEVTPTVQSGVGPLRRQVDSGYRGTDYDFISATCPSADTIAFSLDTKRARTEVRAQSTQGRLLRDLVARASTASSQDARLGRTLFQLLVPPEVEPFLSGTNRMLLELDDATAVIPWELLDTRGDDLARGDDRPWAIRTQLLRRLRQENFRQQVQDASADDSVLVIGEPLVDADNYGPLPGARAEAQAVVEALQGAGGIGAQRVTALIGGDDASSVINALFERRYRIVHVAAHGEPVQRDENDKTRIISKGGVVLSDHTFLGSDEIKSMRTVPELVFVNCCHLAARDPGQALRQRDFNRAEFAWGLADSLIEIGVRCVIAAGWAVDDGPAEVFARTFYREILDRKPFITAVAAAREAAWMEDKSSNTWAAYQAYGDPNWIYRRAEGESASVSLAPREEYESVASPLGLTLALEELAVQSKWMHANAASQLEKARHLQARFGHLWGGMGAVAEAFALVYAEAGDRDAAIGWYQRALAAPDGSASMKTQEELGNQRARRGWDRAREAPRGKNGRPGDEVLAAARQDIESALQSLQALVTVLPTAERHSLCGSAFKRLGLLERLCGHRSAALAAMDQAALAYGRAETQARATNDPQLFYPALNRMALELVAHGHDPAWPGLASGQSQAARQSLEHCVAEAPSFESHAGLVEIDMLQAVARRQLAPVQGALSHALDNLHAKAAAARPWQSLADQAELVLRSYMDYASPAERSAALALLNTARRCAGRGPAAA